MIISFCSVFLRPSIYFCRCFYIRPCIKHLCAPVAETFVPAFTVRFFFPAFTEYIDAFLGLVVKVIFGICHSHGQYCN